MASQPEQTSDLTRVDDMSAATTRFNWVGLNPTQIKGVAQAMALSGMFPDVAKDSAKAFVKIMAGQEMGIAPFQAMSDISIIQGKAAAGGNIHASKVKSHPKYDYKVLKRERNGCSIEFFEYSSETKKMESIGISEFNEDDAKDAGLLQKDMWKKYPRNMYFNRAMTAGVRTYCPDALNGVNAFTAEELGAVVDEDGHVVDYRPEAVKSAPTAPMKATRADKAQDAELVEGKTVIEQVSEALEAKGFEDAADRKAIALAVAGVDSPNMASPQQWVKVLENIQAMDAEALTSLLPSSNDQQADESNSSDAEENDTTPLSPPSEPISAAQKSMLIGLARKSPQFKEGDVVLEFIEKVAGKDFGDITVAEFPGLQTKLKAKSPEVES
jgi:hypothetical protein